MLTRVFENCCRGTATKVVRWKPDWPHLWLRASALFLSFFQSILNWNEDLQKLFSLMETKNKADCLLECTGKWMCSGVFMCLFSLVQGGLSMFVQFKPQLGDKIESMSTRHFHLYTLIVFYRCTKGHFMENRYMIGLIDCSSPLVVHHWEMSSVPVIMNKVLICFFLQLLLKVCWLWNIAHSLFC